MKYLFCLAVAILLPSCASPGDPMFINNAAAAMHGGLIVGPSGELAVSEGLQNRNRPHPFFSPQLP